MNKLREPPEVGRYEFTPFPPHNVVGQHNVNDFILGNINSMSVLTGKDIQTLVKSLPIKGTENFHVLE